MPCEIRDEVQFEEQEQRFKLVAADGAASIKMRVKADSIIIDVMSPNTNQDIMESGHVDEVSFAKNSWYLHQFVYTEKRDGNCYFKNSISGFKVEYSQDFFRVSVLDFLYLCERIDVQYLFVDCNTKFIRNREVICRSRDNRIQVLREIYGILETTGQILHVSTLALRVVHFREIACILQYTNAETLKTLRLLGVHSDKNNYDIIDVGRLWHFKQWKSLEDFSAKNLLCFVRGKHLAHLFTFKGEVQSFTAADINLLNNARASRQRIHYLNFEIRYRDPIDFNHIKGQGFYNEWPGAQSTGSREIRIIRDRILLSIYSDVLEYQNRGKDDLDLTAKLE